MAEKTRYELLGMLDDVSAALETCLIHFGDDMTNADFEQRTDICKGAQEAVRLG